MICTPWRISVNLARLKQGDQARDVGTHNLVLIGPSSLDRLADAMIKDYCNSQLYLPIILKIGGKPAIKCLKSILRRDTVPKPLRTDVATALGSFEPSLVGASLNVERCIFLHDWHGAASYGEAAIHQLRAVADSPEYRLIDDKEQEAALKALSTIESPKVMEYFGNRFLEYNKRSWLAIEALDRFGSAASDIFHQGLSSQYSFVRSCSLRRLIDLNDPALAEIVRRMLQDTDKSVREQAITSLEREGPAAPVLLDLLEPIAYEPEAAAAIGRIGGERAGTILLNVLFKADGSLNESVVIELGRLREQRAFVSLQEWLRENTRPNCAINTKLCAAVVLALGEIGYSNAVPLLLELFQIARQCRVKDSYSDYASQLYPLEPELGCALSKMQCAAILPDLIEAAIYERVSSATFNSVLMFRNGPYGYGIHPMSSLVRLGRFARGPMLDILSQQPPHESRSVAAEFFAKCPDPEATQMLMSWLHAEEESSKVAALALKELTFDAQIADSLLDWASAPNCRDGWFLRRYLEDGLKEHLSDLPDSLLRRLSTFPDITIKRTTEHIDGDGASWYGSTSEVLSLESVRTAAAALLPNSTHGN